MKIIEEYKSFLIEQDSSELGKELADVKSLCLKNIIDTAFGDTKDALQANKYLLEFSPRDSKRGRPTKDDFNYEIQRRLDVDARIGQDYALYESRAN